MSNEMAIAAVTATLRNLLQQGLEAGIPDIEVTTRPVDKARTGLDDKNQLNLFLFQLSLSAAWRNRDMPHQARPGETAHPPLALDLHYLLTVHAPNDDGIQSHKTLGAAMRVLHDHAVLGTKEIADALPDNDLHRQVERVRITPQSLSLEELSKMWSAFQTQCRLSMAYQVSVVLIESLRASTTPLPVLTRGPADSGVAVRPDVLSPFPAIERVTPPSDQASVRLGETLSISGVNLQGDSVRVRMATALQGDPVELPADPGGTPTRVTVTIPDDPARWPAGIYALAVIVSSAGRPPRVTNDLAFTLASTITSISPNPATIDGNGDVQLTLSITPQVWPEQRVALLLGDREVVSPPRAGQAGTLSFTIPDAPPGEHYVRLRVDGVDSLLVDRTVSPPIFDQTQRVRMQQ